MGDYWHCSPIKYDGPINKVQKHSILRDIRKSKKIKELTGNTALYLWERDIMKHPELCLKLILKYIGEHGQLHSCNSFNYTLNEFGELIQHNDSAAFLELSEAEFLSRFDTVA